MTFLTDMIYDRHFGRHPFLPGEASVETDAKTPLKQPPARHPEMWWNGKWEKSCEKSEECHWDNYALRSFLYDYDLPFGMKNAYWDAHACGRVFRLSAVYH